MIHRIILPIHVEIMGRAKNIIEFTSVYQVTRIFLHADIHFNILFVPLPQIHQLPYVLISIFHTVGCVKIRKAVAGEADGMKPLFNGRTHYLFRCTLSIAKNGVGMKIRKQKDHPFLIYVTISAVL